MKWQCALLQRWLPEYPDGDLPAFWRRRLKAHVERCPACRQELAALKEVAAGHPDRSGGRSGPGVLERVFPGDAPEAGPGRPGREMAPARSSWWGRIPYLVGASALAALLLWVAVGYLDLPAGRPGPGAPDRPNQPNKRAPTRRNGGWLPRPPAGEEPNRFRLCVQEPRRGGASGRRSGGRPGLDPEPG